MNQYICIGSLAVETACPNRDQNFQFRHSRTARVNHQDWSKWAAEELCTGRDDFHGVPDLFVATDLRKPKHPDAHRKPFLDFSSDCRSVSTWLTDPTGLIRPFFSVRAARPFLISNPHQTPDFLRDFDFFDFHFQALNTDQKSSTTIN